MDDPKLICRPASMPQQAAAIEEAFADELKNLFGVLFSRMTMGDSEAVSAFATGVKYLRVAREKALEVVTQ